MPLLDIGRSLLGAAGKPVQHHLGKHLLLFIDAVIRFQPLTVLRNALLPVITVIGIEFAFLFGGLVVTEQVFNLNGIGKLFVLAVSRGDYTMIQALVLLVSVVFVLVNFVIDMLYAVFDPRIRYR